MLRTVNAKNAMTSGPGTNHLGPFSARYKHKYYLKKMEVFFQFEMDNFLAAKFT